MKHTLILLFSGLCIAWSPVGAKSVAKTYSLTSPDARLECEITLGESISFTLRDDRQKILAPSVVGMSLQNGENWGERPRLLRVRRHTSDERIPSPLYKRSEVQDRYNELTFSFRDGYALTWRMYDDGLAYRFSTDRAGEILVAGETAEYRLAYDFGVLAPYVQPTGKPKNPTFEQQFFNSMQNRYTRAQVTDLDTARLVFTPLLIELEHGAKLCIAEADLESYPGMYLNNTAAEPLLRGIFAPYPAREELGGHNKLQMLVTAREPYIARTAGPRTFPWRAFILTREDGQLPETDMVYRLAAPSRIEDLSWIKPGKVAWEWWNCWGLYGVDFKAGINTRTYKHYIDFAADYGLEYVILDEGWSVKYQGDLLQVVPEIDLQELIRHAAQRNVGIILWAGYYAMERDLERVVSHYAGMGVKGFKIDFLDRDDQKMLDFMYRTAAVCAKHRMLVDFHGVCKPTGLQRTYPNVVNYEGVFGLEQMKWTSAKTDMVTYDVTLPFIRMVAGPMDYTQGAMRNSVKGAFHADYKNPMSQGTRCRQLAQYVVFESPLTMLCDSPSNYRREEECIRFIASVPTVWDDTKVLAGRVGEYIAVARRSGGEWFVGAMTDWTERELTLEIPVPAGNYEVELFCDGENADRAAQDYRHEVMPLPEDRKLRIRLAPGGGWAAHIYKL